MSRIAAADDHGATAVEYALLLALIFAVIVGAVTLLGLALNVAFTEAVGVL